jgi:hypothetical protein
MNATYFKSGAAFRVWLKTQHESQKRMARGLLLVGFYKKAGDEENRCRQQKRGALHSAPRVRLGVIAREPSDSAAVI